MIKIKADILPPNCMKPLQLSRSSTWGEDEAPFGAHGHMVAIHRHGFLLSLCSTWALTLLQSKLQHLIQEEYNHNSRRASFPKASSPEARQQPSPLDEVWASPASLFWSQLLHLVNVNTGHPVSMWSSGRQWFYYGFSSISMSNVISVTRAISDASSSPASFLLSTWA